MDIMWKNMWMNYIYIYNNNNILSISLPPSLSLSLSLGLIKTEYVFIVRSVETGLKR